MSRYLMTHSLLSSWLYTMKEYLNEDCTTERDKYQEFISVLNREPTQTTEAMQNGIDFENLVTDITHGRGEQKHIWYSAASKIASIVDGGVMQYKANKTINMCGISILLYGRLDVLKSGTIYDIKFSKGYDKGKFISSTQHPMYFEIIPEANQFTYLISNGTYVWRETYRRDETGSIIPTVHDFLEWLEMQGLLDTYKSKWESRF